MSSTTSGELDAGRLAPSGALLAANIALGAAIERCAVSQTDLDATTLDLLVRLDLAPDHRLRAVELCRQLSLSPSHVSRMLDRAEAAGLVERGPDPEDRRASLVATTPSGARAVREFAPLLDAVLERAVHGTLEAGEIADLTEYLNRIEAAAQACPPPTH